METLFHDLRTARRSVAARPALTTVIIITLALGIGANAAIYSFVDAILLRDLPYADPDSLLFVHASHAERGSRYDGFTYLEFERLRESTRVFADLSAFSFAFRGVAIGDTDEEQLPYARVSEGFLRLLGRPPAIGRDFRADEYRRGDPVIILSHRTWLSRFGGDESAIGRTVTVANAPHEIVGVLPADVTMPAGPDVAFLSPVTDWLRADDDREFNVLGRLAPGVTARQAGSAVAGAVEAMASGPEARSGDEYRSAWVESAHDTVVRAARDPLTMILAAAAVVLLIACVNVSSLLLASGETRRRELAVRNALGAGRGRLVRELVAESLLLALAGCVAGVIVAWAALPALVAMSPADTPRIDNVAMSLRVVGVMALLATAAALICGVAPALAGGGRHPATALSASGRTATASRRTRRWQTGLLGAEMALAAVLLFGAVLFATTFSRMAAFDRGFATQDTLVVSLQAAEDAVADGASAEALFGSITRAARGLPAVIDAGFTFRAPDRGRGLNLRMLEPRGFSENDDILASVVMVGPGFFRAAGIPLQQGRTFESADTSGSTSVAVVNESFARLYLRDRAPLGARFEHNDFGAEEPVSATVVGVVGDVYGEPGGPPLPMLYLPTSQVASPFGELVVHHEGDLEAVVAALRQRIAQVAPGVATSNVRSMDEAVADSVAAPRFHMFVVGLFAGLALLVAAVGVYATTAFNVSSRADEIGVRQALGAEGLDLLRMFLRQGLTASLLGVGVGLLLSLTLGRLIQTLLFEVAPVDVWVHATVAVVLTLLALAAGVLPAVQAARSSPVQAIRRTSPSR